MLDDPSVLGAISAPVLLLHGSDTKPFLSDSIRHFAEQIHDSTVHEIPGAGHAMPLSHAEALADVLTEFFSPVPEQA